ncbi:MAG: RNA polymerase sigma factor [Actinomycetota bacterium]|nr:RNA polymerase sigma factor [Actinomycetota bacterium]
MEVERVADAELLLAVAEGDRPALAELYRRHAPWLTMRLQRRCTDPDVVDQVVQDTFLAVWRRPDSYRGSGEVAAWLWGIAVRRLIDAFRRRGARRRLPLFVATSSPSAEELVLLGVEHGDLAGALRRLSPELRAVIQAVVLDGLDHREAGRLLGVPATTVKSRLFRARAQLREELT